MKKLPLLSGLLFLSSLFVACVPAVNPADAFPIAANQAWTMVATDTVKRLNFQDNFKIGSDFQVENGYTFVTIQSQKFGGLAAFDPKNNLFNITLFMDSSSNSRQAKVMSCFIRYGGQKAPIYTGESYFGTFSEITSQVSSSANGGQCTASQSHSMLSANQNLSDSKLNSLKLAIFNLEQATIKFSQHQ
jgi:hypothetical protein